MCTNVTDLKLFECLVKCGNYVQISMLHFLLLVLDLLNSK